MEWSYDFLPRNHGSSLQQRLIKDKGEIYLHSSQDVEPVLDLNMELQNIDRPMMTKNGTAIVAKIPPLFYYVIWPQEFKEKYGYHPKRHPHTMSGEQAAAQWAKFLKEKLNDRDFSKFRTDKPGTKF